MMYEYRKITVDPDSIRIYNAFLRSAFPRSNNFTEDYLRWEYADNPLGGAVGYNAFDQGVLVGHYVTQPAVVNLFGKQSKGLLSLNTAVHPDHRGKQLFTALADMTYKWAAENGFEFVFGVANANSVHGFVHRLGFQLVSPLKTMLGIGIIEEADSVGNHFQFERIWTKDRLEWRMKNPRRKYEISGGRVYANTEKYGIKAIMGNFDPQLLDNIQCSRISSLNPIKIYIGLDSTIHWHSKFYFRVPEKYKSSPLNMIFMDLTGRNRKLNVDDVKFRVIDFDGY